MATTALLELNDVKVRYGVIEAVKGINLTVNEGEIVTLIGGNGAGKTTTLRAISMVHAPSAGRSSSRAGHHGDCRATTSSALGSSRCPRGATSSRA